MTGCESCMLGWGNSQYGQLGTGSTGNKVQTPQLLSFFTDKNISVISVGDKHSLFVTHEGIVYSCGSNDYGQLGQEHSGLPPEKIHSLANMTVIQVSAGSNHSLALTTAGEVFSWGDNKHGQLGRGIVTEDLQRKPKLIKGLVMHSVIQISCGNEHCLALTDDGNVFSWGGNSHGQLGHGSNAENVNSPRQIFSLRGIPVAQVISGGFHSFIISVSTTVYGWGKNNFGQLGVNDIKDHHHPTLCKSVRSQRVKYISCGEDHTVALTADGGVFCFGAGGYGQLGHNSVQNEVLPKKNVELMGSVVTQVTCGRRHTLVYVPASGRVYAFGSNGNGQLGTGSKENKNSPLPVSASFVPYLTNKRNSTTMDHDGEQMLVQQLAAGSDCSFVKTVHALSGQKPADFREQEVGLCTLTIEKIDKVVRLQPDEIQHDLEDIMRKIFSTAACLNASFLSVPGHFGCSSRNHGVDLNCVRKCLHDLSTAKNIAFIQKITQCIESRLLPSLPASPPDVEALRLYLILPEYHLFDIPKYYSTLIIPFGRCIINLDRAASKVLDLWWSKLKSPFFSRIVSIYKQVVSYVLQLPTPDFEQEVRNRFAVMKVCLEVLKKLNSVNEQNGQIISYSQFYVSDLRDKVDIRRDYVSWVHKESILQPPPVSFCNYPFVFDGAAKSLLLQTDALMQMQTAFEEVQRRNFLHFLLPIDTVNPCLVLTVSRSNLVRDTIDQLMRRGPGDFKKPLKVVFSGEEAVDEGGVKKEFFLLLLKELLDPKFGMFKYYEESRLQWFNSLTFEDSSMFKLIGSVCGLAIYNSIIIPLDFPLALYKKLLNRPVKLEDLKELSPTVGKGLEEILESEDDVEQTFCLTFEVTVESFGEVHTIEIVPGGSTKPVTNENRKEYVDAYIDFMLNKSVEDQFRAFDDGFHRVCGCKVLELFHPQELQSMVVGNENYDFHELEKNTEYKGEYHRYHTTIKIFWEVFHDFSLEYKKMFMAYLTGSDRIPILGMQAIKIVIQPLMLERPRIPVEQYLPVAHTCFNLLELPKYMDKAVMLKKLQQAVEQTQGFGLI